MALTVCILSPLQWDFAALPLRDQICFPPSNRAPALRPAVNRVTGKSGSALGQAYAASAFSLRSLLYHTNGSRPTYRRLRDHTRQNQAVSAEVGQSCLTLCNPMDCVAHQAPPSAELARQENWSGLPFPSPGDLPDPGTEPGSSTLQADALPSEPPGKAPLSHLRPTQRKEPNQDQLKPATSYPAADHRGMGEFYRKKPSSVQTKNYPIDLLMSKQIFNYFKPLSFGGSLLHSSWQLIYLFQSLLKRQLLTKHTLTTLFQWQPIFPQHSQCPLSSLFFPQHLPPSNTPRDLLFIIFIIYYFLY